MRWIYGNTREIKEDGGTGKMGRRDLQRWWCGYIGASGISKKMLAQIDMSAEVLGKMGSTREEEDEGREVEG